MEHQKNSVFRAYVLLILAIVSIIGGLKVLKAPTTITLLTGGILVSIVSVLWGTKWETIEKSLFESVGLMAIGIYITLAIGLLVGSWILSGTVPVMIYYGLKLLSPSIFLFMTCIICSLMSLMTGSSWGTIGTVGIALMGVSQGLGIPMQYTAGAIVVGAMFGDKLSPLSDTTIMAPALSGVDIIEHIKHMLYTTVPGYVISLILFIILGMQYKTGGDITNSNAQEILSTLQNSFNLNPLLLLPPVVVLFLIYKKVPSLPVFGIGIILGCICAGVFQGSSLSEMTTVLNAGFKSESGVKLVDSMLSRGGMTSTLGTVAIILSAAVFGAPLKAAGVLQVLVNSLSESTKSWKAIMVGSYITNLIFISITTSYYVCFTVLGPIMQPIFDKFNIPRKNLSRMLEDTGTALCWIIPWGMSGIFASGILGVPVLEYAIYAPTTYLGIVFAFIYIFTGFGIGKLEETKIA
ncbi:MAG: Na+/H+ antiporter NhaC [Sedimentibacter sp.]|uniref:Na+/H+ antiporter NhaC n=1 Tax=Sedimentibacter sp. TaxID=1960295 RepID=UPI0031580925